MQESNVMADILLDPAQPAAPQPKPAPKPAQPVAHVDALRPGTRLAEFEVQGLLGVGGFGLVYRAYDTSLLRTVAIKEYMPAALAARLDGTTVSVRSSADQATYQSGLQSFIAEARLLAKFDHPSLVKVYRFWEANNTAYMVMPLYSGMTLKQARAQMAAPPPEAWLRTVLWSVLQGLHVLHRSDTLHRDISPDNIFLQDMGPPVLLDLGAARRAISDKSHQLTAILKVNYAPIEQYAEAEDLKQGPWTDLYALAAVVYSCLRNDPPLPATARVVRDSMPSLQSVVDTVEEHFGLEYTDEFVHAITHALAVQPTERPQSVREFVAEMGLEAPEGLGRFDWRAALGVELLPDLDETSQSRWATQPQTVPNATRPDAPRTAFGWGGIKARWASTRSRWTSQRKQQAVRLALALIASASLVWAIVERDLLLGDTALVAAPDPAVMPIPGVAQRAASESVPASELPAEAASAPQEAPADMAIAPTAAEAPGLPASAPVAVPAIPAPVNPKPAEPQKPAPKPVQVQNGPQRTANPTPAPKSPAKPAPLLIRPLCADTNFLLRPMCIHRECQKPENARRPVCIENRQRYPNSTGSGQP